MTAMAFPLNQLLDGFVSEFVCLDSNEKVNVKVNGLAWDSRNVNEGDLFFACDGETIHGKCFVPSAIKAGAIAIVLETDDISEAKVLSDKHNKVPVIPVVGLTKKLGLIAARFYDEPSKKMSLIGITGTNGKTSITHLLAQCLSENRSENGHENEVPCGVIGTMGAGLWGELRDVKNTTPGAVELQQWFFELNEQHAKFVAMEVSSHGLAQWRTVGCAFDIAVFTNLTHEHLDYHGDMATYGKAKLALFTDKNVKQVIVNLDDEFSRTIIQSLASDVAVIGVTLNPALKTFPNVVVIYGQVESADNQGMKIQVESTLGNGVFNSRLFGDFNATNLLTVLACAVKLGLPFDQVCQKLETVSAPSGRLERFGGGSKPLVVVDYAHTPDALEKVLVILKEKTAGKLFVLFGCGGDRDKSKRSKMGIVAEAHADVVWLTNDNPRTEPPELIMSDILEGISRSQRLFVELDRAKAIREVVQYAKSNDVVLIAGKGHENYQIIGDERVDFSDREIVVEMLGEAV